LLPFAFACCLARGCRWRAAAALLLMLLLYPITLTKGALFGAFWLLFLATTLLSNGAALLFLLWHVTPREMFAKKPAPIAA
jgi:uncharacterized membrane protein YdjX (TVP38/TMEM64 family)